MPQKSGDQELSSNLFIHCFKRVWNVKEKRQVLRLLMQTRHVSKCDLQNVCKELSLRIRLTSIRNDGDTRVDYYGDSEAE